MYYDGTKLLSMLDINGEKPEIYLCTTNRTGGKTTYFGRWVVNRFLKHGEKFCLLYRFDYELNDVANKFFKDIGSLFFPTYDMFSESRSRGAYHELFIGEKSEEPENYSPCGYAVAINKADIIKKVSHLLSDTVRMLFDEFQSETNHYCAMEVKKFISIHTSVARGQGKQTRYVPVVMIGNPVSLINPYYVELGISERLNKETKFLRGEGFVLEQGYVDSASRALKESAFNRAFSKNSYVAYSSENVYLNDSVAFIEKMTGKSRYICTVKYMGKEYGIREFEETGILYCDDKPDVTFKTKLALTTDDHDINYVMLKKNEMFISNLRFFFERGCFRFKNLICKEVILKMISY